MVDETSAAEASGASAEHANTTRQGMRAAESRSRLVAASEALGRRFMLRFARLSVDRGWSFYTEALQVPPSAQTGALIKNT